MKAIKMKCPHLASSRACRFLALSLVSLLAAPAVASGAESTRIRLATIAPKDTSFHKSLLRMGEAWRDASGGKVSLVTFTDGTMGGEADMVRRMRVGQIQAAMLTVAGLMLIDDSVSGLQNMPLMFQSLEELDFVRERLRASLEKKLLDKGFVVLFWADAGWVQFFSKRPARQPEECRKMKTFVWAGHQRSIDLMKSLGLDVVPLEFTDTLIGLQTGLIEAVPTIPTYALAGQYYSQTKYMLRLNWVPLVGATVVTKKAWDAVPEGSRAALLQAAEEAGAEIRKRGREENEEAIAAMQKRGLQVHELKPEELVEWRKYAESVHPRIRGEVVPADMFDEVQQLLKEYRASGGKKTP
jgi:TRAP-type C4-dicarboxylate transport system substrate-binding protein